MHRCDWERYHPLMHTSSPFGRRIAALLLTAAVVSAGAVVVAAPAQALPIGSASPTAISNSTVAAPAPAASASGSVKISKIAGKKASYNRTVTIKPNVSKTGKVVISKKTLTVKKGSKTVVKNKASAKLKAGTYTVTQKVTYRTYVNKTTTTKVKKQVVGVKAFEDVDVVCTATAVEPEAMTGDEVEPWGAQVDASCVSPRFDGEHLLSVFLWNFGTEWWGLNDENYDELTTTFLPEVGVPFAAVLNPEDDLMVTKVVTQTVTKRLYSKVKTKTSTPQKLVITQGKKPSWVWGSGGWNCPKAYPIKGNASSMIYHVPGGAYYSRTKPEQCFATESAARAEGYRKSKR
jgi:hypothetical protein